MTLAQLVADRRHVLLDFDGPVCAVFGGVSARDTAAQLAADLRAQGVPLSAAVDDTNDPFDVLQAAAQHGAAQLAEPMLRDREVSAVRLAPITPGAREALASLIASRHTITIVSNNSDAAVRAFLTAHGLTEHIGGVVARTEADPDLLKPNPHLLALAIRQLRTEPSECVLIGDSTTDITAAHAAGTAVIAYANKPHKRAAFTPHGPDAVIHDMHEIAQLRSTRTA